MHKFIGRKSFNGEPYAEANWQKTDAFGQPLN